MVTVNGRISPRASLGRNDKSASLCRNDRGVSLGRNDRGASQERHSPSFVISSGAVGGVEKSLIAEGLGKNTPSGERASPQRLVSTSERYG